MCSSITFDREKQQFFDKDNLFYPAIFEGNLNNKSLNPKDYNTVAISLNCALDSNLQWDHALQQAKQAVERGYHLFWQLNFGLFSNLALEVSNQSQYLSLGIAVDHFMETVWKTWGPCSLGASIYKGSIDYSINFPFDAEQMLNLRSWLIDYYQNQEGSSPPFLLDSTDAIDLNILRNNQLGNYLLRFYCKDVARDYFDLLSTRFNDDIPLFCLLDTESISSPAHLCQLLFRSDYDTVFSVIKKGISPYPSLVWEEGVNYYGFIGNKPLNRKEVPLPKLGLVLPEQPLVDFSALERLDKTFQQLDQANLAYRIIFEEEIHFQWDGLDYLVADSALLSKEGIRKIQGFLATGGAVSDLSENRLFKEEIPLEKMLFEVRKT